MNFDECIALAKSGKVCQMKSPDGKWVKFDPNKVITEFRVAPELTVNDGLKVLAYSLHQLEKKVAAFFQGSHRWVDLPERGHKSDPYLTYGHKGYLGGEPRRRTHTGLFGEPDFEDYVDTTGMRLRDVFRSYFRIVPENPNALTCTNGGAKVCYRVDMRKLNGADGGWESLFRVHYTKFRPGDQYNLSSNDKAGYESDWCVSSICSFYLPEKGKITKSRPEFNPRRYTCQCYRHESDWYDELVKHQRIPTLSKITPSGDDIFHNLAMYLINYLTILSDIDMNMENFAKFIDNNMEKTTQPTHTVDTPDWKVKTTGKSLVVYKQYNEFKDYRDAVFGKNTYGDCFLDYYQAIAILLRYFNNKYHGTIDEVRTR